MTNAKILKNYSPETSLKIMFSLFDHSEVFEALFDKQASQLFKHLFRNFNNGGSRIENTVVRDCFNNLRPDIPLSVKNFKE